MSEFILPKNESYHWELITLEKAEYYLSLNKQNRRIRRATVDKYKRDILSGSWDYYTTDNKISISEDNELKDGQHRLTAVVESGYPVWMRVFTGISNKANIFDRGAIRSTADILNLSGKFEHVSSDICSTAKLLCRLCLRGNSIKISISDSDVGRMLNGNYSFIDKAVRITRSGGNHAISKKAPCMAATTVALKAGISEDDLMEFYKIVNSGFPSGQNPSPAIVLNKYLIKMKLKEAAPEQEQLFNFTVQAIYDFINNIPRTKPYNLNCRRYQPTLNLMTEEIKIKGGES